MEEYSVTKLTKNNVFVGVIAGMGHNQGTWDYKHSLEDAKRFAAELRSEDPDHNYVVEDQCGPVADSHSQSAGTP